MSYNVSIDANLIVRQSDLEFLYRSHRLGDQVLVLRVERSQLGGGFGDQNKYPYAWAVVVTVDSCGAYIMSARGLRREWTSLDRLERWLREQGFRYWSVRNDLEPTGLEASGDDFYDRPPFGIK